MLSVQDDISQHNLNDTVRSNEKFAKAVYTDRHSQMVIMCMQPGDCISKEKHDGATQFFSLKSGFLRIEHWKGGCDDPKVIDLGSDGCDIYVVPAGDYHRIVNPSENYRAFLVTKYCGKAVHASCYVKECADCKICHKCYMAKDNCACKAKCNKCDKPKSKCGC